MLRSKYQKIIIVDFGSQVTQLIARIIRGLNVYCEIENAKKFNYHILNKKINNCRGIIFSGGPDSVSRKNFPKVSKLVFKLKIPILGICYGHQLISHMLGGKIIKSEKREYGNAKIFEILKSRLTKNFFNKKHNIVWMSHSDEVIKAPKGFKIIARSRKSNKSILENQKKKNIHMSVSSRSISYQKREKNNRKFYFFNLQM